MIDIRGKSDSATGIRVSPTQNQGIRRPVFVSLQHRTNTEPRLSGYYHYFIMTIAIGEDPLRRVASFLEVITTQQCYVLLHFPWEDKKALNILKALNKFEGHKYEWIYQAIKGRSLKLVQCLWRRAAGGAGGGVWAPKPGSYAYRTYRTSAARVAAEKGDFEILQWLRAEGCPLDKSTCCAAALGGHLEILQWLRAEGCPWGAATSSSAALGGHLRVLQWARDEGCPWNMSTCWAAATGGHLEVLQWARAKGCPWDAYTCAAAALKGHLEVLQWARAEGCPWDEETCSWAAKGGHLEVLQWARSEGCPWNTDTCKSAAERGHVEVLQWARAAGCPCHVSECIAVAERRHPDVAQWLLAN